MQNDARQFPPIASKKSTAFQDPSNSSADATEVTLGEKITIASMYALPIQNRTTYLKIIDMAAASLPCTSHQVPFTHDHRSPLPSYRFQLSSFCPSL